MVIFLLHTKIIPARIQWVTASFFRGAIGKQRPGPWQHWESKQPHKKQSGTRTAQAHLALLLWPYEREWLALKVYSLWTKGKVKLFNNSFDHHKSSGLNTPGCCCLS